MTGSFGGVRAAMGAQICEDRQIFCEGLVWIQPGVLTGDIVTRFDLNAGLSLRITLWRLFQLAAAGGYSLDFDGANSIIHVGGQAGFVF